MIDFLFIVPVIVSGVAGFFLQDYTNRVWPSVVLVLIGALFSFFLLFSYYEEIKDSLEVFCESKGFLVVDRDREYCLEEGDGFVVKYKAIRIEDNWFLEKGVSS